MSLGGLIGHGAGLIDCGSPNLSRGGSPDKRLAVLSVQSRLVFKENGRATASDIFCLCEESVSVVPHTYEEYRL